MVSFDFLTPQKIIFGSGRFKEVAPLAAGLGRRALVVTGWRSFAKSGRWGDLQDQLKALDVAFEHVTVKGEPTVKFVDEAVLQARLFEAQVVISIGGGSVLDTGKAIAALLANGGEVMDYLEVVGRGQQLTTKALPHIAVPTTAGTGSEATKNAVISNQEGTFKRSLRAEGMLPTVALVDPELTLDCPPDVTAACGMDALTQLLESYVGRQSNPLVDCLARQGLRSVMQLAEAVESPKSIKAREAMAMASLLGGICLANAGLGVVHAFASPLGARLGVPHGLACAAVLPAAVRINADRALKEKNGPLLKKYAIAAKLCVGAKNLEYWDTLGSSVTDAPLELIESHRIAGALSKWLRERNRAMKIPALSHFSVTRDDIPRIIGEAGSGNLRNNPVDLSQDLLTEILEMSI